MTQRRRVNKEEWADWKGHPVTEEFFFKVREAREELLTSLARFHFPKEREPEIIGVINGLTKILEADFVEE